MAAADESEEIITVFKDILGLCQRFLPEGRTLLADHPSLANARLTFLWKIQRIFGILNTIQIEYDLPQDIDLNVRNLLNILKAYCEKIDERISLRDASGTTFETRRVYDGRQGRPKYSLDYEQVEGLVSMGFNWKQISDLLSVSERTLRRWRANVDFSVSYTNMDDDELDSHLRQILRSCPSMGERMAGGALRARGIRIQRQRLRDSMRRIDPVGRLMRRLQVMRRRVYRVEGPNALWFVNICPLFDDN